MYCIVDDTDADDVGWTRGSWRSSALVRLDRPRVAPRLPTAALERGQREHDDVEAGGREEKLPQVRMKSARVAVHASVRGHDA